MSWSGEPIVPVSSPSGGVWVRPSNPHPGRKRKPYIIEGRKLWLTEHELAVYIANLANAVTKDEVKLVKKGKPKPVSKPVWNEMLDILHRLDSLKYDEITDNQNEIDDEETILAAIIAKL